MGTIAWTRREGPLVPFAEGYRQGLLRQGYTAGSVNALLKLVGQLNRWLLEKGLTTNELTPARAEEFFVVVARSITSMTEILFKQGTRHRSTDLW